MPYKIERFVVPKDIRRAYKLTEDQRIEIKRLYDQENYTIRQLESMYNVSYSTIRVICKPECHEKYLEQRRERYHEKGYESSSKLLSYLKDLRKYKYDLLKNNILKEKYKVKEYKERLNNFNKNIKGDNL